MQRKPKVYKTANGQELFEEDLLNEKGFHGNEEKQQKLKPNDNF